jgi:nickel/cobalt exporter
MSAAGTQRGDAFTELIALETLDLPTVLFALAVAFVWGAMHGMTPGHGKTIVGAYLVGSRGTAKHALYLGLTTTVTHTLGVFALGLVTLLASQFIFPEQVFPWISFLSGLLVVGIGLNLGISRLREVWRAQQLKKHPLPEGQHEHNGIAHSHDGSSMHSHLPPSSGPVTWRTLLALGISGGLLPCPSALVVMLGAIALGKIGFGLILVLAFSVGLAAVLTGIGLTLVYASKLFKRVPADGWIMRLVPAASAAFITVAGIGITVQALGQLGWWMV